MTIANPSPETNAAIALLFGTSEDAAVAAEAASPIAQAVAAAAQQLQHVHEGELDSRRLAEAMQLVLSNSVTLHLDGASSVQNGARVYSQKDNVCSCPDHQQRGSFCKHLLAAELYRLAQGLLRSEAASEAPALPAAPTPASAAWDVHEAPVSCYLKFRVGHLELSYTMRDVDDNHLSARLTKILPKIHALAEDEDARREQLAAAQAEAKQQAASRQPAAEPAESPAEVSDLQLMIQQAVQHMLGQRSSNGSTAPAMPAEPEARYNEDGDKWCILHEEWMPERSNAQGSWHSHPAEDEQGEYYCKGNGRPRRSRR
jgi:hypothetical protein